MRKLLLVVASVTLLGACGDQSTHIEQIEGVDCMVREDGLGRVKALDCDWENRDGRR